MNYLMDKHHNKHEEIVKEYKNGKVPMGLKVKSPIFQKIIKKEVHAIVAYHNNFQKYTNSLVTLIECLPGYGFQVVRFG